MHPSEGYGIDLGDGFVAVARAERSVAGTACLEVLRMGDGRGDMDQVAVVAEKIRREQRHYRAMAAAALPCQDGFVRRIRIPWRSLSKARRVLPSLVDTEIPLPLEECQVVFPSLRRSGPREITALAVIAPRKAVESRLEILRTTGFDPAFLVFEGLALWQESLRSVARSGAAELRLVVYAGADRWAAVGGIGDEIRWTMAVRPAPAAEGGAMVDTCEAFLRRMRAESDIAGLPLRWFWCGPALPPRALRTATERQLGERWAVAFDAHAEPEAFLARALAHTAVDPVATTSNLRTGDLEHPDWPFWRRRAGLRAIGLALVASAALVSIHVAALVYLHRADRVAQERLRTVARTMTGGSTVPYGREEAVARSAVMRRRQAMEPFSNALQMPVLKAIKALLQAAAADGVTLQEVMADERRLSVSGTLATPEGLARIEAALQALGWQCSRSIRPDGAFTLEGSRP